MDTEICLILDGAYQDIMIIIGTACVSLLFMRDYLQSFRRMIS